jgi:hypothetical protein
VSSPLLMAFVSLTGYDIEKSESILPASESDAKRDLSVSFSSLPYLCQGALTTYGHCNA